MVDTPKFRLWLALQTGRLAAIEAEASRIQIPDEDLRIEVRRNGRWVHVKPEELM